MENDELDLDAIAAEAAKNSATEDETSTVVSTNSDGLDLDAIAAKAAEEEPEAVDEGDNEIHSRMYKDMSYKEATEKYKELKSQAEVEGSGYTCLLYTSPSPRD